MKKQTKGKFKNIKSTMNYANEERTPGPLALSGLQCLETQLVCAVVSS